MNTYGYVGGNPTNWVDPYGLATQAIGYGIGRVVVAPAINFAIRSLTAGTALTLGDWLYGVFNENADGEDEFFPEPKVKPKPDREQKPENCPTGTKPIDKDKRLDRGRIHDIKDQISAGPKDWVGIDKDGNIWTNEGGRATNNGPFTDYINK